MSSPLTAFWNTDTCWFQFVEPCSGSYARKGRPVRKVEIMGVVVTVDQKERYTRFTCKSCVLIWQGTSWPHLMLQPTSFSLWLSTLSIFAPSRYAKTVTHLGTKWLLCHDVVAWQWSLSLVSGWWNRMCILYFVDKPFLICSNKCSQRAGTTSAAGTGNSHS